MCANEGKPYFDCECNQKYPQCISEIDSPAHSIPPGMPFRVPSPLAGSLGPLWARPGGSLNELSPYR